MFIISHSKSLKFGLFTEEVFPRRERRPDSIKYKVIFLLPNMPLRTALGAGTCLFLPPVLNAACLLLQLQVKERERHGCHVSQYTH
jgi:hypothetical protein